MTWCNRTAFILPYSYCLCSTPKLFKAKLKELGVKTPFLIHGAAACTHTFRKGNGEECAIVTIGNTKGQPASQIVGLIAHEAVHVWQEIRERMGEKEPSSEFEAYTIQHIFLRLLEQYDEQSDARANRKCNRK